MAGKTITALGNITAGQLYISDRDKFDDAVANVPDCVVEVVVTKVYSKRSNQQSKYYHGVVLPLIQAAMSDVAGERLTHGETHEWLKRQFNSRDIPTENGHIITLSTETRSLDTAAFSEYIERCRQFAADTLGIDVPDPIKLETANQQLP
ncbi:hypothetical protein FAES_1852 [Fibrella aestuarina BUZ 2]|uniref:Uncharacterized protein n=1 Tax=Fibrella aestuarina BUZ 2 TaxID=1166018 RepID=I0K6V9_9BACT|nr:hypothetical protein [Fibrella aestuarina]CCG99862.1 hypothetical protein FAES_1852 [Fibrella aestuarina BUZ 2]